MAFSTGLIITAVVGGVIALVTIKDIMTGN